jgi:GT2 family glycosyltransferase
VRSDIPVQGNRWDLLPAWPSADPTVSVVIVHYNQPEQLARTWRALRGQTLLPTEVVIADDGSTVVPSAPRGGPPTTVVAQPDLGFRAAAARNLGAAHCCGEILVFLDADTVPAPDFLRQLTRRVAQCRDVVAVGRRRHADLRGLPVDADPAGAVELDEPAWLRDGYAGTADLLAADGRSFRFVISAVMACRRALHEELGGFDERFVGYGGEDWDFAYRAWNAGAVLVHEPGAVAWHDGPEWAGRPGSHRHEAQTLRLAALIPEPSVRGAPLPHALPDVLADIDPVDDTGPPGNERRTDRLVRCVHSLLRQGWGDVGLRVVGAVDDAVGGLYGPVLRTDPWTVDQRRRARARLEVRRPLPADAVENAMGALIGHDLAAVDLTTGGRHAATLTSTRALARSWRWRDRPDLGATATGGFGRTCLEVGAGPPDTADLAGFFARPRR